MCDDLKHVSLIGQELLSFCAVEHLLRVFGDEGVEERVEALAITTFATSNSRQGRVRRGCVVGVEPEYVDSVVIPERHNENHALLRRVTHGLQATHCLKCVSVVERGLLGVAEVIGERVGCVHPGDVRLEVLDNLAVLDVQAADLRGVRGQELCDSGDNLSRVDREVWAEERFVTHAEGAEVKSILVAENIVAVVGVITTVSFRAASLALNTAHVRGHSSTHGVGHPDIHLNAASAVFASSHVRIVGRASC